MELREQIAKALDEINLCSSCKVVRHEPCGNPCEIELQCADTIIKYIFTPAQLAALADGGHIDVATKDQTLSKLKYANGATIPHMSYIEKLVKEAHFVKVVEK